MRALADFYYTLPDRTLLKLFCAGFAGAAAALIARYDGRPLVANPNDLPPAVLWAELLAGRRPLQENDEAQTTRVVTDGGHPDVLDPSS